MISTSFHDDDKTISLMWTEYSESFSEFYKQYLENKRLYKNNHGVLSQPDQMPPSNSYTVSCLPWISFDHFAVHSYNNKAYYFPSVEAGKFIEQDSRAMMPLSITAHHATTDGWHIKEFLSALQDTMNHPQTWI